MQAGHAAMTDEDRQACSEAEREAAEFFGRGSTGG
jgi:hypothetical protein